MVLFSVIVPVYNVENYLRACLDSIINQSFKDFEIVLVNDGSTDKSKEIADEYAEKHAFIKVINQKNGGLSSARNMGVRNSKGKYLLFIDSDDLLADNDVFKRISEKIKDNEVLLLGFEKLYFDNTKAIIVKDIKLPEIAIDEQILEMINKNEFVSSACNKCIQKDFFVKNKLYFMEGLLSEDIEWSIRLLLNVNKLDVLDGSYYYYRQSREGSISTVFSKKHGYDLTKSIEDCLAMINQSKINYFRKQGLLNYLAYQYMVLMAYYPEFDKDLKRRVKKLGILLNYDSIKKVKIINLLKRIAGFEITALLMNKFVRNRK